MLESLFVNIVSGFVVAVLLEWWRARRTPQTGSHDGSQAPGDRGARGPLGAGLGNSGAFSVARVFIAIFLGFWLSAVVVGILEATGHPNIKFGEPTMLALFVASTAVSWIVLTLYAQRRR